MNDPEPIFEREWTVRFSDTDMFGIAYYPGLVTEIERTADFFMEDIGLPFWTLVNELEVGLPIVDVRAQFSRALPAGETVTISMSGIVGDSSVRFDYVGRLSDGDEAFTAYEQRVCVPVEGDASVPLPDELRRALLAAGARLRDDASEGGVSSTQ